MERRPGEPTQPIRPAVPPQGGPTAPLRGPVGSPRRPSVSGRVVAAGIVALLGAFGIGFFAGNAGDEPQPAAGPGGEGGGGGGGGRGCRRALALSEQTIALQQQAITNRTQFTQAALGGDEGQLAELNQQLEPISAQLAEIRQRLDRAMQKCRDGGRGGGGGGGGQGGGGGGDGGGGGGGGNG